MRTSEKNIKQLFEFQPSLRFEIFYAMQGVFGDDTKVHSKWREQVLAAIPNKVLNAGYPLSSSGNLWPVIADILTSAPLDLSFEQIIERLQKVNLKTFTYEVVNGAIHYSEISKKAIEDKNLKNALAKVPKKKQEWLAHIGLYPYDKNSPMAESLSLLLQNPSKFRKECIELMKRFWECDFKRTWQRLQPSYQKSLATSENLFHSCTLDEFAKQTLLKIEFDSKKSQIRALRGGAITPYEEVKSCAIIPSAFNEKRFWTAFNEKDRCAIYIPLFDPSINLIPTEMGSIPDVNLDLDPSLIFRALGDTTRYAMMKLIAKESRTSLELAKELSVSKPTISHHLHILRQAHLVDELPVSGSIRLSVKRSTIESLSEISLADFFRVNESKQKGRKKK